MPESEHNSATVLQVSVRLPPEFTRSHRQSLHRYLSNHESLSGDDWALLIQAIDVLRRAEVTRSGDSETFSAIYDRLIDAVYSDSLIEQLLGLPDPESESESLRAATSRRILTDLRTVGLWQGDVPDSQLLVAFCLYWWQMFVRGYAFEVAIYRDLAASGVAHTAHNLRDRLARLSGHDLEVMGFQGDVKTSTYFMLTRRGERLAYDFYITRMYHVNEKRWYRAVWVNPLFWRVLNGEPTPVAYEAIWQILPGVAQITLRGREFVVVFYEEWKQRVIARQTKEAD
jgi:hypothetical protein